MGLAIPFELFRRSSERLGVVVTGRCSSQGALQGNQSKPLSSFIPQHAAYVELFIRELIAFDRTLKPTDFDYPEISLLAERFNLPSQHLFLRLISAFELSLDDIQRKTDQERSVLTLMSVKATC